jgi:hypothetical protein
VRWVFLSLLVVVAGAVPLCDLTPGGCDDTDAAEEPARAELVAGRVYVRLCPNRGCSPSGLTHQAGAVWEVTIRGRCYLIDAERFSVSSDGSFGEGLGFCE